MQHRNDYAGQNVGSGIGHTSGDLNSSFLSSLGNTIGNHQGVVTVNLHDENTGGIGLHPTNLSNAVNSGSVLAGGGIASMGGGVVQTHKMPKGDDHRIHHEL